MTPKEFQFTRPQGRDMVLILFAYLSSCFNSRARRGATKYSVLVAVNVVFQFTRPQGRDVGVS